MSKRRYTKIKEIEPEIIEMRKAGKSRREIADHFGLEICQIEWWVSRYNKSQAKKAAGIVPRPKGRPRKNTPTENIVEAQAKEIAHLKMENQLLRDFLRLSGRM